ncbi:EF-Tu/IF-2/RF-3 family GTPase, partial [Acinetobacter baumannii]
VDVDGPFQMQIISLAYSSYVGVIGTGRVKRGKVKPNMPVSVVGRDGSVRQGRVLQVLGFMGLDKHEVPEAQAGDIIAIT